MTNMFLGIALRLVPPSVIWNRLSPTERKGTYATPAVTVGVSTTIPCIPWNPSRHPV